MAEEPTITPKYVPYVPASNIDRQLLVWANELHVTVQELRSAVENFGPVTDEAPKPLER
jgi:hypothetical protein